MGYVIVEEIKPGMVLSETLRSDSGQVLMPEGLELAMKHIPLLNRWKIKGVNVKSDDDVSIEDLSEDEQEQASKYLLGKMTWKPINDTEKDMFNTAVMHNLIYKGK